jgi:ABC-type Mn2+/Zn2+ transport system ATPase subunit
MVELARAVVDDPKLLLLDEPASGLDETETERLGDVIQSVRRETGCAVLLVEHNAGFVMEQSDRIVVLNLGTKLAEGLPAEIQRDAAVREAYLGETLDAAPRARASPADPADPADPAEPAEPAEPQAVAEESPTPDEPSDPTSAE